MVCCYCPVTPSCLTLCGPMGYSMPGFSVLHYLQSLLQLMSLESVMSFNHLILCRPLPLLPSIILFMVNTQGIHLVTRNTALTINITSATPYSMIPHNNSQGPHSIPVSFTVNIISPPLLWILEQSPSKPMPLEKLFLPWHIYDGFLNDLFNNLIYYFQEFNTPQY